MTNNYTVVLSKNKRNIRFLLVLFSFLVVLNLPFKYSFADFEKDRIEFIEACKNNVPEENLLIKPLENYIKPEALGAFKDYYKTFVTNKKALLLFCFEGHKLWQTFNGTLIQWQENIPTLAQSIINRIFLRGVRKMKGDETPPLFLYNAELANSNDTSLCKILLTGGPEADTQQLHMAMLNASMNVTSDVQVQYYKFATAAILKEVEESQNVSVMSGYEAAKLEMDFEKFLLPYLMKIVNDNLDKNANDLIADIQSIFKQRPLKYESIYCEFARQYFKAIGEMPGFSGDKLRELVISRTYG